MSDEAFKKYICKTCGLIYDEALGDPDSGLAPGTRFEDIPNDWYCPLCLVSKDDFILVEDKKPTNKADKPKRKKMGGKDAILIVGSGYAGWQVAEEILAVDPDANIGLVTGCDGSVYPKPAISMALSQGRSADDLIEEKGEIKADRMGIAIKTKTKVMSINTQRKKLTTTTGSFEFNKLILATGAKALIPTLDGDAASAVMTLNDIHAYRKFRKALVNKQKVAIIGSGLIAVEMAEDLASSGIKVDLFARGKQIMSSLLPESTSIALQDKLSHKDIQIHYHSEIQEINQLEEGYQLIDQNRDEFGAELIISAIGLRPNIDLAKKAKLDVKLGVSIDDHCLTSHPDIYAIGDCSEKDGVIQAYLEPIRRQAKAIAAHISEKAEVNYQIKAPLVKTKTPSLPIMISPPLSFDGKWQAEADGEKMLYLCNDEVTGFALSGDMTVQAPKLYQEYFAD